MNKIKPFKLERYFAKYEFNTEFTLCSSDCESLAIKDLLALEDIAEESFRNHWLGYTESTGSPSLRREVSQLYNGLEPEHILILSGAEEGIFTFMQAALEPGDHLIVQWPCYQSLFEIADSQGCKVTRWEAREENGWSLDTDELEKLVRPETRAIVINNPHNPTGYLMSQETYQQTWKLASSRGILLFSDEVYRESEYLANDRLPSACELGENGISLGVMSKSYGLAGLRIGWIATRDKSLLQNITRIKDYTTICSSAPSEFLAELALRHREKLLNRNLGIIMRNLKILDVFFKQYQKHFQWVKPKAGPIAFPRLLRGNVEQFCHQLVTQAGVLLLPGSIFDYPGNNFRLGFGRANLPEALDRLESFLSG
ncbi:MAG: aminotransferase class I/II-fold pyridoxal phosphate-dependent enzyme [Anaerolineales bacterium]